MTKNGKGEVVAPAKGPSVPKPAAADASPRIGKDGKGEPAGASFPAGRPEDSLQNPYSDFAREAVAEIPEVNAYVGHVRNVVLEAIERRRDALVVGGPDQKPSADPLTRQYRGLLKRMEQVDAHLKGFVIQLGNRKLSPTALAATVEEILVALNALLGIELEAKAAETRILGSAILQEYAGSSRAKPVTLSFDLDQQVADAFKSLYNAVRAQRERRQGATGGFVPEDLLAILVALGQANVPLLANLGAPELQAAPLGLAALHRVTSAGGGRS
jgi:hypothetical protein